MESCTSKDKKSLLVKKAGLELGRNLQELVILANSSREVVVNQFVGYTVLIGNQLLLEFLVFLFDIFDV